MQSVHNPDIERLQSRLGLHATTLATPKFLSHIKIFGLVLANSQALNHALSLDAQKWVLLGVHLVWIEFKAIKALSAQALGYVPERTE